MPTVFPLSVFLSRGQHPVIGNFPTGGVSILPRMDKNDYPGGRNVLAENLTALMKHAKTKNGKAGPATGIALEAITEELHPGGKVSHSAISRYRKKTASAHLDHLVKIAEAYNLQVWQLLYPKLKPASPPAPQQAPVAQELFEILEAGQKLAARLGAVDGVPEGKDGEVRGDRPDRTVSGPQSPRPPKS